MAAAAFAFADKGKIAMGGAGVLCRSCSESPLANQSPSRVIDIQWLKGRQGTGTDGLYEKVERALREFMCVRREGTVWMGNGGPAYKRRSQTRPALFEY
jgi:hypothetical protein